MDIRIRPATPDDLPAASLLFDRYRQFYGQPSDRDGAHGFLAARLAARQSIVLLAWRGDDAVGFCQLYPMFSSVRMAPVWVLNDLYVDAGARRQGVGRRLLDAAKDAARAAGAARVMLETARENLPARALYREAGWEEESTQWYSVDLVRSRAPG